MPKSKRSKIVSLTNVKPHQKEIKEKSMNKLEANFKKFNNIVLIDMKNLTAENQKAMANELPGVLIFAKKTIMRVFFKSQLTKYPELEQFIETLEDPNKKEVCLLMTNSPTNAVVETLKTLNKPEFAHPGTSATGTVVLTAGDQVFQSLSTSNDSYLRTLGLFVTVQNGYLYLQENFVAAEKNKPVSIVQSKVLKMLGIKAGTFQASASIIFDKSLGTIQKRKD